MVVPHKQQAASQPADSDKTWQQTKSENTRACILEATLDCFYELGYGGTTTEKVAKRAGVSRGAMLHHFPSRVDLVKAAVRYLYEKRLSMFEETELKINEGAEHSRIDEGIDAYWQQLHSPLFTVFHELQVAARTDPDLHGVLNACSEEMDRSWGKLAANVFPDLALSGEFENANLLTMFLLEGMAVRGQTSGNAPEKMIPWLKEQLHSMFADVAEVDRNAASKQVDAN
jgi:AcrR family transcriptional regulator